MYGTSAANGPPHRPEPVTVAGNRMDEEYDYTAGATMTTTPTPTSASAYGMEQNRSYLNHANNTNKKSTNSMYFPEEEEDLHVSPNDGNPNDWNNNIDNNAENAEDALLDLAQLEELHDEAERMKAVGNKHMAAQEYVQAYNAYSAALQLSPVGPSSHVFLSNRAAALLSLKRYSAAATDARRAVALAPTFGKAHARLGQALYFLKDYSAAVVAYEEALAREPGNVVTEAYLEKARQKLDKQQQQQHRNSMDGGGSVRTAESSVAAASAMQNSIATDPAAQHNIVQRHYHPSTTEETHRVLKNAVAAASTSGMSHPSFLHHPKDYNQDDPELEEAVRIQQRANQFLVGKQYRQAIEEYTAALFLVPDDVNLSPDLHLGRAHALNGSRRHESAKNDAVLALKLQESPAAYSTLAKSLFYMKDYQGAVDAFAECQRLLPSGESLGMFDQSYLKKAQQALLEEEASLGLAGKPSPPRPTSVPKLPPPRFVPREQAMQTPTTATARSMPKQWPLQQPSSVMSRIPFQCGPEREVLCLSEGLGVKLNRGSDGVVRVWQVTESNAYVVRQGEICVGDVVREAAGVDLRRPITNVMWGDTVALVKMAPRPITLTVAKELSPVPLSVLEEQKATLLPTPTLPSRASDDSAVAAVEVATIPPSPPPDDDATTDSFASADQGDVAAAADPELSEGGPDLFPTNAVPNDNYDSEDDDDIVEVEDEEREKPKPSLIVVSESPTLETLPETVDDNQCNSLNIVDAKGEENAIKDAVDATSADNAIEAESNNDDDDDGIESVEDESSPSSTPLKNKSMDNDASFEFVSMSLRDDEEKGVGGEILFLRDSTSTYAGWDTLRWMSHNGVRKINFCQQVYRIIDGAKKRKGLPLFWKTGGKYYEERAMIVYDEPSLILIVRRPANLEEIRKLLGLPDVSNENATSSDDDIDWALNPETAMESYWILESVADPTTSKLRLSPLTTATSVASEDADDRERSCFQILTPADTIILSAVNVRAGAKKREQSFTDSGAFLETLSVEASIARAICGAHSRVGDLGNTETDIAWKHQLVIGSLHSLVLSGNLKSLDDGIAHARSTVARRGGNAGMVTYDIKLPARIIDAVDDNGFSALYYACSHQMDGAVRSLVRAGADVNFRTEVHGLSMLHLSARNLDDKILSTLLSAASPTQTVANALDKRGRTPMYVAMVEGSVLDNGKDPHALVRCIVALEAWGGTMMAPDAPEKLRNPVSALAYMWLPEYLSVVLDHIPHRFPLERKGVAAVTMSLGALYQYPIHSALVALRKQLRRKAKLEGISSASTLISTIQVLFEHGFEPNERLDAQAFEAEKTSFDEFIGYSPIQILALLALELDSAKQDLDGVTLADGLKVIEDVAEFLVKNGARLSLEPPPAVRLRSKVANAPKCESVPVPESAERRRIEILTQKLDADKQLISLLGGEQRLNSARKVWTEMKKVAATSTKNLVDEGGTIENSACAGGSDSLSCAICWSAFGTLINRKHRCRVTNRFLCDDCSAKRLVQVTSEYRLSDGQFLLARLDAVKEQDERSSAIREKERSKSLQSEQARLAARLGRLEAEEQTNRDSLFGGMLEAATSFVLGEDSPAPTSQTIGGLTTTLDQTRDALNQRGERLASLNDKSAKLVDSSADFAKMATELRKQSEGGFFW